MPQQARGGDTSGDRGFDDLGFARVDVDRERRQGVPEVVYGPGKQVDEITEIVRRLLAANTGPVLVTRVEDEVAAQVMAQVDGGVRSPGSRLIVWRPNPPVDFRVTVVTGGTADGPVAQEAAAVMEALGLPVRLECDVGVAGLHRLLAVIDQVAESDAVIVVAGMEGALASVVGGLVACPVVAVPTSAGYGAALGGMTALLAMASSCAAGLTVVNIDSGFGAAMAVFRLAHTLGRRSTT